MGLRQWCSLKVAKAIADRLVEYTDSLSSKKNLTVSEKRHLITLRSLNLVVSDRSRGPKRFK